MNEADRIQFLEKNLERQLAWISAADAKVSFVFAVDTAMLGLLAALAPKVLGGWTASSAVLAAIATVLGVGCMGCLSFASFPRTDGPKGSLIFFGGVVKRERDQFRADICTLPTDEYVFDLCAQCHRNAEIAAVKFRWVQRALVALYVSVVPWCLAVYLLYAGIK